MTELEKDIEQKLRREVEALGGKCLKWTCHGWVGVPDRIVLMPGGRIYFVETKTKGGRLSAMQNKWAEWLVRLGFTWCAVWDDIGLSIFLREIKEKQEEV